MDDELWSFSAAVVGSSCVVVVSSFGAQTRVVQLQPVALMLLLVVLELQSCSAAAAAAALLLFVR